MKHGIDIEAMIKAGMAGYALTDQYASFTTRSLLTVPLTSSEIFLVVKAIGGCVQEQITSAKQFEDRSIPRDFRRSIVKEKPFFLANVDDQQRIYVPCRQLLIKRITDGLYYDVVGDGNARNEFGRRFEMLSERVTRHYFPEAEIISPVLTSYGEGCDLICNSSYSGSSILIECKSRRLPSRVLSSPNPWVEYREDYQDLVKAVVQVWRTHDEISSTKNNSAVGMILLYEAWTVFADELIAGILAKAHQDADEVSIGKEKRIPVAFVDFIDWDKTLRTYDEQTVFEALQAADLPEYRGFLLSNVCSSILGKAHDAEPFKYSDLAREAVPWWGTFGKAVGE